MSSQASRQRLPASVIGSIGLHALILFLLFFMHASEKNATRVISNVDLMIQVHRTDLPRPIAHNPPPPSPWNFLKMALPAVPHVAMQQINMHVPEHHMLVQAEPKLQ